MATDAELEELVSRLKEMARLIDCEFIPDPEKIRTLRVDPERSAEPPHAD